MVTVIALASIYPLAMYTPYIGLKDKSTTHSGSLSDRSEAISRGLERAGDNPFGYGMYSSQTLNIGICLLSSMGGIGIFGFACQAMILSGWRPGSGASWKKLAACAPILVTALISEPIAGEPAAYILVMAYLPVVRRQAAAQQRYAGMPGTPVVVRSASHSGAMASMASNPRAPRRLTADTRHS